jgi:hypothetical protein
VIFKAEVEVEAEVEAEVTKVEVKVEVESLLALTLLYRAKKFKVCGVGFKDLVSLPR